MLLDRWTRPLLQTALGTAGGRFDVAVVRLAQAYATRSSSRPKDTDALLKYLGRVADHYDAVDPDSFFAAPPQIRNVRQTKVRPLTFGAVTDLSWPSGWVPHVEQERAKARQWRENQLAHVRFFRHERPAPTIVCIHGYRMGDFRFEERAWGADWLYRLGLNVALFTLPYHARRAPPARRRAPLFPSPDVIRTNESFGQAIWDVRGLLGWLRSQGLKTIGVGGMSLGGYTASLLGTVDSSLEFLVPFVPLSDMTDVFVDHEALRGLKVPRLVVEAGKRALSIHRPLARAPKIEGSRVLVVGAKNDRITPHAHAVQLAKHFGAQSMDFPGGHLLQFGRRKAFGAIAKLLTNLGVIERTAR